MPAFNFNAANQEAVNMDSVCVKKGWYPTIITKSEINPTKDNTGTRLDMGIKILDGPDKDKVIFVGFNVQNKSEAATRIGMGMLTTLALAVNRPQFTQTEQLHNIPFLTKFKVDHQEGYEPRNEMVNFKPASEFASVVLAWLDTSEEVVSTPHKAAPKADNPFASNTPPAAQTQAPFTPPANAAPMTADNVNPMGMGTAGEAPAWLAGNTPSAQDPAQQAAPQTSNPATTQPPAQDIPAWAK